MIGLLEAFTELDKLYEARKFNQAELAVSDDSIFKFLSDINDLNSALKSRIIWSNIKTDGLQFDEYCDQLNKTTNQQWGFVSLTAEPTKVALELRRPFGIEFDLDKLKSNIEDKGYHYREFNQVDMLMQKPPAKITLANCLKLNGIGARKDGTYFFSLQGDYEPRDIDEATYLNLLKWLKDKSHTHDQLMHFDFTKVPEDEICVKQKNNRYKHILADYFDKNGSGATIEKFKDKANNEWTDFSNRCFLMNSDDGIAFGVMVRDYKELWVTCLNKYIGLNSISGYNTHKYNTNVEPLFGPGSGVSYALDQATFDSLRTALNEYEFRVYLPMNNTLRFEYSWVKSVRLPNIFGIRASNKSDRYIGLKDIFDSINANQPLTDNEIINICNNSKLPARHEIVTAAIVDLYKILTALNLNVLFYDYEYAQDIPAIKAPDKLKYMYTKYEPSNKDKGVAGKDRSRYFVDKSVLANVFGLKVGNKEDADNDEYRVIRLRDKEGNPSLIYKDLDLGNGPQPARLEVRGIILTKDENGIWYINIVDKNSWYELPGGSFENLPANENGLYQIAANKLNKETGLNISASNLTMLDQLTYMNEQTNNYIKQLTKNTDLLFKITIDWTFITVIDTPVDVTKRLLHKDEPSYWLVLDWALKNIDFMKRYFRLKDIINNTINKERK